MSSDTVQSRKTICIGDTWKLRGFPQAKNVELYARVMEIGRSDLIYPIKANIYQDYTCRKLYMLNRRYTLEGKCTTVKNDHALDMVELDSIGD